MDKKKNVVILLSGGLDSTTIAYLVKSNKNINKIFALTFDYNQRHKNELKNALRIGKKIKAFKHEVVEIDLSLWGGSSLTDKKIKISQNRNLNSSKIPNTYVPARNLIFLSFALSYAEAVKASEIYIGVNAIDYSGYVDCRPGFIKCFQELANIATVEGVYGKGIKIKTPLISKTKAEIIKLGHKLGVDYSLTRSCYTGKNIACGTCDSCRLRLKGFSEAGLNDPIKYSTTLIN